MKAFLVCSAMYLIALVSHGQQNGNNRAVRAPGIKFYSILPTNKTWTRVKEVPLFKTKDDSLNCVLIETELFTPGAAGTQKSTKAQYQRRDSLIRELTNIFTNRINGIRKEYAANPKYYSLDSLLNTKNFAEVKQLSISNRSEIPDELLQCTNLEKIELINTSIKKVSRKLNALPHLSSIEVYNNKPKSSLRLAKNEQVKTLTFQYNEPGSLPHSYKKFKSLESLQLPDNGLTSFVNGTKRNRKFRELDLSNNSITLDKNNIAKHKSLKNLVLTRNNISSIPSTIGKLKTLGGLTLAYNSISSVAPEISKLQKLEQLSFYKNQLPSIPSGVFKLTSLNELDLYYNQIETVPDSITSLKNLSKLYLAYNRIIKVTDNLGDLVALREVYLYNNRITALPESLANLHQVEILRVNDNYLTQLPASLSNLTLLENLDIARNNFRTLNVDLNAFSKLNFLDIAENPWGKDDQFAAQLKKLEDRGAIVRNFATGEYPDIRKND